MQRMISEDLFKFAVFINALIERYGEQKAGFILENAGKMIRNGKYRGFVKPGTKFFVDGNL